MMKRRVKTYEWIIIATMVCLIGIGLTWTVRGVYDRLFMFEGRIVLVNTTDQPIDAVIVFPSGKQHQISLPPAGKQDFIEKDTGEGSVSVSIPGRATESVGYVTSMNRIIVLSIDDDNTTFSQIFP